ncbi:BN860_12464g1_1 [Zygosaccharomyces bailii CLIB 213]|uniref:BN860_12464g1_1 n=1 Tax=Zygosaccharomyces bailii (strain CLIB 213 / ATCC 58445 / CBS 680 / BCRC 21525 / NBRC 1098 / NCYC 1416 / NRRL Y-2227) TaxID=1333698 RepID=A0A8J2T4W3_ZYGB2|nr:BN860_12464g1_1 [Zygosaccharomyces bailii CLIB 213]
MLNQRVIEVDGSTPLVSLPIVRFPPFNLRALLIEKDPVVWAHFLETYVVYFEYLASENNIESLDESTYDNLCIFVRSYLHESAEEKGKVLSLGMNKEVSQQSSLLRTWVFILVKKCGLLHFQIFGEHLWNLVRIYVEENPDSVRGLIDGSLVPQINTLKAQLNKIPQVQQRLKQLVENGKFTRVDLKSFECLLSARSLKPNKFADEFLTTNWLETLELWWAKGRGRHGKTASQLAIVSLLSASLNAIITITKEMGISNLDTLALYPLLGSLLIHENFIQHIPGLKQKLPYLNFTVPEKVSDQIITPDVKEEDVNQIGEIFPHLTTYQRSQLLKRYDGNVELAINALFENPNIAETIMIEENALAQKPEDWKEAEAETVVLKPRKESSERAMKHVPEELKNKNLSWALKLMYEDDEDEPDDTYIDAEGAASSEKFTLSEESENSVGNTISEMDKIQGYLWGLLKEDKTLFERSKRGTKARKEMRKETNWADEQIEGWARILEKSPQRARILEDKFMFKGNVKSGKTSYVKNKTPQNENKSSLAQVNVPPSSQTTKTQRSRDEKRKAAKANHNRKRGHDKKLQRAGGL